MTTLAIACLPTHRTVARSASRPSLRLLAIAVAALLAPAVALPCRATDTAPATMPADCPLHAQHMAAASGDTAAHARELDARGDAVMGFAQAATTHHFRLADDGGAIEVTVRDAVDAAMLRAVRAHLQAIAAAFTAGDFGTPEAVHAQVPPGVEAMRVAGHDVRYGYEEIAHGGRVVIHAASPLAVAAVHDFLRFQIAEHRTGDPTTR